ncbi:hypothetical protein D1336_21485 [Salmonella enterica subsp. enterica serovar Heidelberg]|nr:hypothetical protein [Salmonella enterica subsp. enterica serovar Heidelberg]EFN4685941.1 hypothetical protein [Escherichia coli]
MSETDALKGRIENIRPKTIAAKLRELMPEIDRQVRAGVQHDDIVETLNANGFDVNLNTFRSYLYRYRKKARVDEGQPEPKQTTHEADGNSPVVSEGTGDVSPDFDAGSLADALDARKRDELGDKYVGRHRPIFSKRSDKK